jgi:hypothetical protein
MIEQALLDSLEAIATGLALTPAPKLIGVIEPVAPSELPALVVAIEQSQRLGNGLGERATLFTHGVLAWQAEIDLANPVLATDQAFSLLSGDRKQLILPHGGLVRKDGSSGAHGASDTALGAADIQLTVQGTPRTLTQAAVPGPGEFSADPASGTLVFGQALPPNGMVEAHYYLGQWEQRVVRSSGVLRLAILAADAATVRDLSNSVLSALVESPTALPPGLSELTITEIGSIGSADPPLDSARQRVMRLHFDFEQQVNVPDASGGIIQRIPIQVVLEPAKGEA